MKIFDSLIKAKNFIFWTVTFNLTLAGYKYISGGAFKAFCAAFAVLLSVIILSLILDLIKIKFKKLNKFLKFLIIFLSAGMFLLDMFALHYYKCRFDAGMLDVIFGTKPAETFEFLNEYVLNLSLIKFFVISFIFIYVLYLIYKKLADFKIFWALNLILVLALTPFYEKSQFNGFAKKCISPFNLFDMLYDVYRENKIFNEMISKSKREINFTKNNSSINNFIFIVGESTSRNHMSLYNYNLNTTPLLNSRRAEGELYVFNNALSPNAYTIPVMEKLFTFYDNKAKGKWYEYTNLFSILNEAGYKTFWLSNQETFGKYSRAGKFYASQGGISQFTMVRDSYSSNNTASYDGNLLKILDKNLNNLNNLNFYVLHIMGTHSKYTMRYPEEFNKFKAQDEVTGYEGITQRGKEIRAEYDNAVLYNDYFIDQVIKRFEDKEAILIYISDHGEEVYDTRSFAGHFENNAAQNMFEIPFIIWTSQSFKIKYKDLCERINSSVNNKFNTQDMIHVILDILEIETSEYDPSKSVINKFYEKAL